MKKLLYQYRFWLLFIVVYFLTHLLNLVALPVFADEAIYIRWAQLIMDDCKQYLFFPLNDGKTPLLIWFFVPFQYLFSDPLLAARLVSVITGLLQTFVLYLLAKVLGFRKQAMMLIAILTAILPFWFFHSRMALMDSLMTLFLSLSLLFSLKLLFLPAKDFLQSKKFWQYFFMTFISFGLSLWTKLPAVLFGPVLLFLPMIYVKKGGLKKNFLFCLVMAIAVFFGLCFFLLLKIHPAFSQIFARGGDFLFKLPQLLAGEWRFGISQLPRYYYEFSSYLTPVGFFIPFLALFFKKNRRQHLVFILLALIYILPILIFGRVVYARYFLPVSIFFTLSIGLFLDQIWQMVSAQKQLFKKALGGLFIALIIGNVFSPVAYWFYTAWFDVNHLPIPQNDRVQYLSEWSAGQGIKETAELIINSAQSQRIVMATEGYFGTLPDGILMYLHRKHVNNIAVTGIGQPVRELPQNFVSQMSLADQVWLLVNSHRLKMPMGEAKIIRQFCRPDQAPCLELWNITTFKKN